MHPDKFLKRDSTIDVPLYPPSERIERLEALSKVILDKRSSAVDFRKSSGIERVWLDCEEAHLGIDDINRGEFADARWSKPTSMSGPVTSSRTVTDNSRSSVYVRVTSRYVFGAAAKLSEILLPIDDKAFSIKATPDPVLVKQAADIKKLMNGGQPAMPVAASAPVAPAPQLGVAPVPAPVAPAPQPSQGALPAGGMGAMAALGGAPTTPAAQPTEAEIAKQKIDLANAAAAKAEMRIYDWMLEGKYAAEVRKVIDDAARCGTGVLKGPYFDQREAKAITKIKGAVAFQIERKVTPTQKWVDFWNIFPDESCGENIHDGDHIFELDHLSEKMLRRLKDQPGYLKDQIDLVIEQGPGNSYSEAGNPADKKSRKRFPVWYFYGVLKRDEMMLLNEEDTSDLPEDQDEIHAIVTIVNDTVVRAVINPMDSGNFPYRVMTWSRRPGSWTGIGVAEQMVAPQRMVNAATRALLNNAGLSAGPQIIVDQSGISPADNNWKIYPNKIWYKTGDVQQPVQNMFAAVNIPSAQAQMSAVIEYAMKMAEEATGIPLVTQGQTGTTTPQTFGAAELQNNNAHTWLRSIGERFDDQITGPLVDDYYELLLLDPDVPDDEKGDFTIDANGSAAMIERAIQETFFLQLFSQVGNPAFQLNPEKLMEEALKAKRIDPRKVQYSKEEQAAMAQAQHNPPIQIAVEQLKGQNELQAIQAQAKADLAVSQQEAQQQAQLDQDGGMSPQHASALAAIKTEQIKAQTSQNIEASRSQTEMARAQTEQQIAEQNGQYKIRELELQKEIALLQYSTQEKINLQDAQTQLAASAMDNATKQQLAAAEISLSQSENAHDRDHSAEQAEADRQAGMVKHVTKLNSDAAISHNKSLVRDTMSLPNTP